MPRENFEALVRIAVVPDKVSASSRTVEILPKRLESTVYTHPAESKHAEGSQIVLPPNERTPAKSAKGNQPVVANSNIGKTAPPVAIVSPTANWTQLPSIGKEADPKVLDTAGNDGFSTPRLYNTSNPKDFHKTASPSIQELQQELQPIPEDDAENSLVSAFEAVKIGGQNEKFDPTSDGQAANH